MANSRRSFLKRSGALVAALSLPPAASKALDELEAAGGVAAPAVAAGGDLTSMGGFCVPIYADLIPRVPPRLFRDAC